MKTVRKLMLEGTLAAALVLAWVAVAAQAERSTLAADMAVPATGAPAPAGTTAARASAPVSEPRLASARGALRLN